MKLKTPHHLLLLMAIIIYIAGIFQRDHTFDLHLHDTYYVLDGIFLTPFLSFIPLTFWLINLFSWKYLFSKKLYWIHVMLTIFPILLFISLFFVPVNYHNLWATSVGYYDYREWNNYKIPLGGKLLIFSILLLVIAQLIYLFNLIKGLYRYSQSKGPNLPKIGTLR